MRRIPVGLAVVVLAACSDLPHESAFDPEAPRDRQATTAFAGSVSLEAVAGVTPPLAGVQVSLAGTGHAATTDAAGAFTISGVPAGTYTLQALLAGYDTASVAGVTATLDTGGTTVQVPPLALRRVRADLAGNVALMLPRAVVEATGGASVTLGGGVARAAVTGAAGGYVIADVPAPIGSYTLSASKVGYLTQSTSVTFQNGAFVVQPVQLEIDPGAFVGTVTAPGRVDGSGNPDSAGITVRARGTTLGGTPWEEVTLTAAGGRYRMSGLPAGAYTVSFELQDHTTVSTGASVAPGSDTSVEAVALAHETGTLRGTITLSGATASAGVVVTATSGARSTSTVTDAAGAFSFATLDTGAWTVSARKDPDWQASAPYPVNVSRNAPTALDPIPLFPVSTGAIAGTALLEGATDHSGTTVTLGGTDFRGVAVAAGTTAVTAASGAWAFPGLRAGSYQVTFSRASFDAPAPTGVSLVTGQAASAGTLTLAASRGSLSGTVTAAGAASNAGTVVEISGGPDGATAVASAAGTWQVTGLRVGTTYAATYRRTGYVTQATAPLRVDAGATTAAGAVELLVATTGAITGVATVSRPADAAASAGIVVSLTGTDLNGAAVTASAVTGSGGGYALPGLPQGTYTLAFSKTRYDARQASGLAVVAGGTATAPAVTLPVSTGSIAGQVVLSAGTAAGFVQGADRSGVVVSLTGLEPDVTVAAAVTDAAGNYRFDGVPVHTSGLPYGLTAQRTGYGAGVASVVAAAGETVSATPSPLTLSVQVGSVTGNVAVNDTGTRAAPANGAVTVTLTGTAFNATAFAAGTTNAAAAFTLANLPAGTYGLTATSANRTCTTTSSITVSAGQALNLALMPPSYTFVCTDAVAPGAVTLGTPQGAVSQPGFTNATGVSVPIAVHASDTNAVGYQYVAAVVPSWNGAPTTAGLVNPVPFPAGTLSSDGTWTLWIRAVDQVGNAGPASSVQVVRDTTRPANVTLTTARPFVNDTTTTAVVGGGADANFRSYQACTSFVSATTTCPSTPPCALADDGPTLTLSFASASTKACVYAQAADQAGNVSLAVQRLEILSDLTPPTAPVIAPIYDPTIVTVRADAVDFFVTSGATDAPAGGATPWKNVAWLEVDVGGGYQPLCPFAGCRNASNVYNPCSATCGCVDARLVCDGTTFKAIRVPLLDGSANSIGVRAVDLAGNVGSGATQQVPTSITLYPVAMTPDREGNPRGRGRLVGYRYTDSSLRLRDLGTDGRPGASDRVCEIGGIGAWGGVVPRVAVLGPNLVVHADGDATLNARRPGTDDLFCTAANDDTTYAFYSIPGTTQVWHVTGSYNHARTGEYAAWLERDPTTHLDTVKVQAPNALGHLANELRWVPGVGFSWTAPPAPVTLYAPAGAYAVQDLLEGGDCLLIELASSPRFIVYCKAGGLGNATGVTPWTLPASATGASLSSDGTLLAWVEQDTTTSATRLHVRSAGADRLYGTGDDTDATRLGPGAYASPRSMTIDAGHVLVSEAKSQGSYWLLHWSAGPDAVFDGATTADDTVSRVLPSSIPRDSLTLLAGPHLAYGVTGDGVNLSDVLAVDLSTFRWETVDANGFASLATNGAGTLFFQRGSTLTARLPNGNEQQGGFLGSQHAATGTNLLTSDGATVNLRRLTAGSWFGTPTPLYSGDIRGVTAGGRWGLILAYPGTARYRVSNLSAGSPTTTLLPVIGGSSPGTNGFGVSDSIVAYQCDSGGWSACFHHPGLDGAFATGDDVTGVLNHAGAAPVYGAYGLAVSGDKIAFDDGTNMIVVATGADGLFNTSDDVEYNLGAISSGSMGNIAVAGNYAAWLRNTSNGMQVMYADLGQGITRQLTTHYSNKDTLALDPSGRLTWIDYAFTTPAIFVFSP